VSGQYTALGDVSCPDVGDCVAVGGDKVSSASGDVYQALIETLSDGTWTPTAVPDMTSKNNFASLAAVACPAKGSCVAVGFLGAAGNVFTPVIETLSGGRWTAAKPALPGDAAVDTSATLNDVACPAVGTCIATGWYGNQAGQHDGYVATLANGTWTAVDGPLPADAAPEQYTSTAKTYLAAIACPRAGSCVAPGQYLDNHGQVEPFIATLSGGTWAAVQAPLPTDAAPGTGQSNAAYLELVTCPAVGHCVTVGSYPAADGTVEGLIETAVPR
jgi:hypothetical protein